jgi:hypothetical protein
MKFKNPIVLGVVLFLAFLIPQNVYANNTPNFVDERFELLSLVFRLSGNSEYNDEYTDYQRGLYTTFADFQDHSLMEYVRQNLSHGNPHGTDTVGYDAVFLMAVHLEKIDDRFELVENIDKLVAILAGLNRWTNENVTPFVALLNDFYIDTNFSQFYQQNMSYYQEISAPFYEQMYSKINFDWFSQYGANPNNMRVILSPSSSRNNYGSSRYDDLLQEYIAYAAISVSPSSDYKRFFYLVIHEFCHSFANSLSIQMYAENADFRSYADKGNKSPSYSNPAIVGFEYLTRAYTILYLDENNVESKWRGFIRDRFYDGFHYIEQVYAMITPHTPMLNVMIGGVAAVSLTIILLSVMLILRKCKLHRTLFIFSCM